MRAAITTGDPERPVTLSEVDPPSVFSNEALVRVHATSLNAGEVRRAASADAGNRVGWDLAGVVERVAADGSGPKRGTRVVAFVEGLAWAELVAVRTEHLGVIPDGVSFADAATLPIAGLTALRTLRRGGDLLGKRVLIVPGTGGVGLFAIQLAAMHGAIVTAVVRNKADGTLVQNAGAEIAIAGTSAGAKEKGPYDVILDSLGGESLATALSTVAPDGVVVTFGTTVASDVTFNSRDFYLTGGASLHGFIIFHEVRREPMARDLERLGGLVLDERLATHVDATYPFAELAEAVAALRERRVRGKIVVTL